MDLSLQSLPLAPWQLHRGTGVGPLSCSSSQLGLLARKSQLRGVRCSVAEEGEPAQEKPAAKGAAPRSWLQADAGADPYFGWTSNGSQTNGNSAAGWIKIGGGVVVLAIGFALGARNMYARKEASREFAVPHPATEQIVSPSKASESSGTQDNVDASCDLVDSPDSNQGEFVKQEKESQTDGSMPDVQHQEKSIPGQVSLLSEDVEDYNEKEDNFNVSSLAATTPISEESLEHTEGFLETSTADTTLLPPSEDVTEEGFVTSDPSVSVVDGSRVATHEGSASPVVSATTATSEESLEHTEGFLETSAADTTLSRPSEDATEEGFVTSDPRVFVVDGSRVASDEDSAFPVVSEIYDTSGKDVTPEVDSSSPEPPSGLLPNVVTSNTAASDQSGLSSEEVSAKGDNTSKSHYEPDVSNGISVESASQESLPLEDDTSLSEPCLPEPSLHDESVQNVAFDDLEDFSSSSKKNGLEKMSSQHDEWDERNSDVEPFASARESGRRFLSAGMTAPSTPLDGLPKTLGRVVVPAPVDHMQEQLLVALQALKVIEAGVEPGGICTRREYARWLIAASATLSRSPAHRVFPAMYIENSSKLAYDDVLPEDPDFPFIQGLAEAGLISSRLLGDDIQHEEGSSKVLDESNDCVFSPDSPLTRQDLIAWKVALERKPAHLAGLPSASGKEALQEISGFIDIDKIHHDAWPALIADMASGERSIIALAFGYTRRFQPEKPVTKAQAAVALATGEAWELVSEELARIDAEGIAEAAVVAELALETKAQQEVATAFNELLQVEREKQQAAVSLVETTLAELEQVKAEREEEKYTLLKERVALDSEKEFLSNIRHEVEEQALALSSAKLEVSFEKEQVEKLLAEAEEERATISKVRSELEIEKNALTSARAWAEDVARKALAHSKVLEQVRKRWESQGVQVHVDKELDEVNIPGPSWHYSEGFQAQNSPMYEPITKSRDLGRMFVDAVMRFFQFVQLIFHAIKQQSTELGGGLGEKFHEARIKCADTTAKTVESIKQTVPSSVAGMTSSVREGTLKAVDEWKGGAERLAQKFKIS